MITIERSVPTDSTNLELWTCLSAAANAALETFISMRCTEGEALRKTIDEKLKIIEGLVASIEEKAPEVVKEYEHRLKTKLSEIDGLNIDENRILTEILIFSDKSCIDEELTRLKSHITQMHSIIYEENPVGRKLDFLVQEMNRETNTIGSKSNNIEITGLVVRLKGEIEKIREQVQNIE
jgi:uncharacterized protein (TIGR00255 family)